MSDRLTRVRRLGALAAAILIVGFLAWGIATRWNRVSSYDWHLDPALLAAGIVVLLVYYLAAGVGYVAILERLDDHRAPRLAVLSLWAKSLLGRYVPGNVLMVAGRVVLGRAAGIPGRVSLAASVYEQVLALTAAAVASLGFLAAYEQAGLSWAALAVGVVAALVLIHPRAFKPLSTWALTKIGREPLGEFLSERQLVALFVYYALAGVMQGLGVWLLVRSSAGSGAGDPAYVALAFLLSFVVGMVAFVFPSGLGVRDAAFAVALGKHLPTGVAVAVSAGVRLVLTAVELVFIAAVVGAPWVLRRLRSAPGQLRGAP